MKKKILSMALVLILTFALAGCYPTSDTASAANTVDRTSEIERQCAEYIFENYDTLFEDELNILYGYLDCPEDFDSSAAAFDAIDSIEQKLEDLNSGLGKMSRGEIDIYY